MAAGSASPSPGKVTIMLMTREGTIKRASVITARHVPGTTAGDKFGAGLGALGDVDGDGVVNLASLRRTG